MNPKSLSSPSLYVSLGDERTVNALPPSQHQYIRRCGLVLIRDGLFPIQRRFADGERGLGAQIQHMPARLLEGCV